MNTPERRDGDDDTAPADEGGQTARRRRPGRIWAAALGGIAVLWLAGLLWFAADIPNAVDDSRRPTDAVVVLTGGSDRLETGVALLAEQRARKLFISGVHRGVDVSRILRLVRRQGEDLECCMVLGHSADDTRGNARETARWMAEEGYATLRLVTASYHMRRSLLEFRRAMPGIDIVPHPVFPPGFKAERWWRWPGTAQLLAGEYLKYLVALVRPW